jgi:hypothetical protein
LLQRRKVTRWANSDISRRSNSRRYLMTLSASARKFTGNSMPVAFAVLRLITNG